MRTFLLAAVAALAASGCVTYGPQQYAAMSAYDLCELQHYRQSTLSASARSALADELKRRNENCSTVLAQIRRDREDDWLDRMYNRQSP